MPFMTRMILIALHATVIPTLIQTTSRVVAAPLPPLTTAYARPVLSIRDVSRPFLPSMRVVRNVTSSSVHTSPDLSSEAELINPAAVDTKNATSDPYIQLVNLHQATKRDSKNLKKLAAQSAISKANDAAFRRKCVAQLNDFHSNILRQQAVFSAFADNKHKTISSRSEDDVMVELLNGMVKTCKDGLKYSEELVKNIPILGPICAPIVYDVKCFVDDLLNYSRDVLIDILKGLPPDIRKLLGA